MGAAGAIGAGGFLKNVRKRRKRPAAEHDTERSSRNTKSCFIVTSFGGSGDGGTECF